MRAAKPSDNAALPAQFDALVRLLPARAIMDGDHHERAVDMIDHLMAIPRLSADQSHYLETLVQLVQAYEAAHHAIHTSRLSALDSLRHLLAENNLTASNLSRLLGVHASMGSKILNGDRALTIDHVKRLAARFKVGPEVFIDSARSARSRSGTIRLPRRRPAA